MFTTVSYVDISVVFHFSDGRTLTLNVDNNVTDSDVNEITSIDIKTALSAGSSNPLGSVASNTLELELESYDHSLFPDNTSSSYYGVMDRTCYITVEATKLYIDPDDEETTVDRVQTLSTPHKLGTYYVEDWESESSAKNVTRVVITASDLITTIANMDIPIVAIDTQSNIASYLTSLVSALNNDLPSYKQIELNTPLSLGSFDVANKVKHRTLKTDGKVGDLLNQISSNLLVNIYMSNDNKLSCDSLDDDVTQQAIYVMSDDTNLTDVKIENGLLVDYSGVNVKFPLGKADIDKAVCDVSEADFSERVCDGLDFADNIHKLTFLVISSDSEHCPKMESINHDNSKMDLTVSSVAGDGTYSVDVYGSTQSSSYLTTEPTYLGTSEDSVITLENTLLKKSLIDDYQAAVVSYMRNKRSGLSCSGSFDIRLCLGDFVTVTSTLLDISTVYKVTSLKWSLANTFSCDAELTFVRSSS